MQNPLPALPNNLASALRRGILLGIFIIALLVAFGLLRFPGVLNDSPTGLRSLIGVVVILLIYTAVGWFGPDLVERTHPLILRAGLLGGLLAGLVFVVEMLLEYVLLPKNNNTMGLVEYGLVLALFFLVATWVAWRTAAIRNGVLAALCSALIAALIWFAAVLLIFYIYNGTPQQIQVFSAEGDYSDFARSGLSNFYTFVMEDFMGAGFFHSLLLPAAAAILGTLGATLGKALSLFRKA